MYGHCKNSQSVGSEIRLLIPPIGWKSLCGFCEKPKNQVRDEFLTSLNPLFLQQRWYERNPFSKCTSKNNIILLPSSIRRSWQMASFLLAAVIMLSLYVINNKYVICATYETRQVTWRGTVFSLLFLPLMAINDRKRRRREWNVSWPLLMQAIIFRESRHVRNLSM